MDDGAHLALAYDSEIQLETEIVGFVRRGILEDQLNVLLVPSDEAKRFEASLRESGVDVGRLLRNMELVVVPVESLFEGTGMSPPAMTEYLDEVLICMRESARQRGMRGVNVIGRAAGLLAKRGELKACVALEEFWRESIAQTKDSEIPITLLCPYETIPDRIIGSLERTHNLPIAATRKRRTV